MPNTVFNDKGEALNFDNGQWKPAPVVSNPEGKRLYFDGAAWQPFPESAGAAKVPPETAAPAAGQAPSAPAPGGSSPATGATPYANYLFGEKPKPTGFLPWDTVAEYPFNLEEGMRSGLAMAGHGGRTAAEGDPSGAVGMLAGGANAVLSPLSAFATPLSRPVEEFLAKPLERATGLPHEIGTPAIMALPGVFMGSRAGAPRRAEPPIEPDFANMKDVTPPKPPKLGGPSEPPPRSPPDGPEGLDLEALKAALREDIANGAQMSAHRESPNAPPQVEAPRPQLPAPKADTRPSLEQFVESGKPDAYLNEPGLEVYARRGNHMLDGERRNTFDIPKVDALEQGQGAFTAFLKRAEEQPGFDGVYVENVIDPRFGAFLERQGYKRVDEGQEYPSFYKPRERSFEKYERLLREAEPQIEDQLRIIDSLEAQSKNAPAAQMPAIMAQINAAAAKIAQLKAPANAALRAGRAAGGGAGQPPIPPTQPPAAAPPPGGQPPNYGRVNVPGPAGPPPKPTTPLEWARNAADLVQSVLSPTSRGPLAAKAEATIRDTQGRGLRDTEQTRAAFDGFHRLVNGLSPADRYQLFAYVQGRSQGVQLRNPALQPVADVMRDAVNLREQKLAALPSMAQMQFRTDYLQQLWQDPNAGAKLATGSKQGLGGFTRKRTYDTIADGIAAGLRLKTDNAIDMTMNYVINADRFVALNEAFDTARSQAGGRIIRYARPGQIPQGYAKLNGRLGEKLSPQGGKYVAVAPEPWALIWNRFVDKGFHEFPVAGPIFDEAQAATNMIQALQFGFNAYHGFTVAVKGMASEVARGLQAGASGNFKTFVQSVVEAPFASVSTAVRGKNVRDIYTGKKQGTPEQQAIIDLLTRANMRFVGLDHSGEYQYSPMGSYWSAWRRGALKAQMESEVALAKAYPLASVLPITFRNLSRVLQTISDPLMKHYVPLMRDGAAFRLMQGWLENHPNATQAEKLQAARDIADDIDNRMGEMVHDNLFWPKTMKQVGQLVMISFSWFLGEVRTIAGGTKDAITNLPKGELANRTAFILGYAATLGTLSAILQYLMTGQGPESWRDLVFPRTGGTVRQGGAMVPERLMIPGQHKDLFATYNDPWHELSNKIAAGPKFLGSVATGEDWRGDPIAPHDAAMTEWAKAWLKFTADSFAPMAFGNKEKIGSAIPSWARVIGFKDAPMPIQNPEGWMRYERMQELKADQAKRRHDASDQRTYKGQYDGE